jgi:hypothetical protein
VPNDLVESYFAPLEIDLKIHEYDHKMKNYSMLPVKDFYASIPETVRYYLNE